MKTQIPCFHVYKANLNQNWYTASKQFMKIQKFYEKNEEWKGENRQLKLKIWIHIQKIDPAIQKVTVLTSFITDK